MVMVLKWTPRFEIVALFCILPLVFARPMPCMGLRSKVAQMMLESGWMVGFPMVSSNESVRGAADLNLASST